MNKLERVVNICFCQKLFMHRNDDTLLSYQDTKITVLSFIRY